MRSWSSPSPDAVTAADPALIARRFVEASRRAEIVGLLNAAADEGEIARAMADELCEALEAELAFVLATRPVTGERETLAAIGLTAGEADAVASAPLCRAALATTRAEAHDGEELLGLGVRHLVLAPWRATQGRQVLVGVGRLHDAPFDDAEIALLDAVTASAGHALERVWLAAERDRHAARQAALAAAARSLSASLVAEEVLRTLAEEVAGAVAADASAVFAGRPGGRLELVAGAQLGGPDEDRARGVADRVATEGRMRVATRLPGGPGLVRAAIAAPIRPHAEVEAVVLVGFRDGRRVDPEDADLVAAFADLAAMAYRNAVAHAAARRAAAVDSLTGCLNHGAFQDRLREELARAERAEGSLALALLDLNEFKAVNDTFGHPSGDALLRDVAAALRGAVRSYDTVARYGGDEFALLLPDTDEDGARRVVDRALRSVAQVPLPGGTTVGAGAGLAQWRPGDDAPRLVARADHALLQTKRARRRPHGPHESSSAAAQREDQRLRRLAVAGTLGTRLARLLDERAIAETAVVELGAALGYERCVLVRREPGGTPVAVAAASQRSAAAAPPDAEVPEVVHRALAEQRTVLAGGELAVPVRAGAEPWGAIGLRSEPDAPFGDEDAHLVEQVAEHLGAALRTARLYANLDRTYLGTAAALAAALEAKDLYTADHAQSIAELAVEVGAELGLDEEALRDLRYGAIFHDIGKIAIPDAILNKPGPLDDSELAVVRRHPEVGEQILEPVPFLAGVREIVRHDHERWDGAGYPDGLRGEAIPLGARVVLVVDAYHAMRSDRPYRRSLGASTARAELLRHAGTQFDPQVVDALLTVLERSPDAEPV